MLLFHDTAMATKPAKKAPARREKAMTTRLQQHRAEMRRRGFKLVQLWVPDPGAPGFREAVQQTKRFLEAHPDPEWDAFAQRILDEAPGWDET
jgi:hypothetical protein